MNDSISSLPGMRATRIPGRVGILFLGGAKRVSMGRKFIDAARMLGLEAELYSYELSEATAIAAIAHIVIGRKWSDPNLLDDLHRVVAGHNIDIIIPFVDGAVEVAARYRDRFGDVYAPVGDPAGAAVMFDKIAADGVFRSLDLPVPRGGIFPMIAKPRFGSASKGIKIIDTPEELASLGDDAAERYLLQEYIARREEITVDCFVALDGRVIAAVPRRRLETQGGEASVTCTLRDSRIEELARRTLLSTGLLGAVTVQILHDLASDRLMLMEINPRLGGGAVCACHAGAPLPLFILKDALGMKPEPCDSWKADVLVARYFDEVAFDVTGGGAARIN